MHTHIQKIPLSGFWVWVQLSWFKKFGVKISAVLYNFSVCLYLHLCYLLGLSSNYIMASLHIKGFGVGPWLVLVSPCFRENVVTTCKIGSFLCRLDNLRLKNVIFFFFGNQISKWRSFEKRGYFWPIFTFFSHHGKVTKIPSAHISLTYIHVFCSPYWLFLPYQFWKKYEFIRYGFFLV